MPVRRDRRLLTVVDSVGPFYDDSLVLIVLTMVECRDSLSVGTHGFIAIVFDLSWIIAQLAIDECFHYLFTIINIYLKRYV